MTEPPALTPEDADRLLEHSLALAAVVDAAIRSDTSLVRELLDEILTDRHATGNFMLSLAELAASPYRFAAKRLGAETYVRSDAAGIPGPAISATMLIAAAAGDDVEDRNELAADILNRYEEYAYEVIAHLLAAVVELARDGAYAAMDRMEGRGQ